MTPRRREAYRVSLLIWQALLERPMTFRACARAIERELDEVKDLGRTMLSKGCLQRRKRGPNGRGRQVAWILAAVPDKPPTEPRTIRRERLNMERILEAARARSAWGLGLYNHPYHDIGTLPPDLKKLRNRRSWGDKPRAIRSRPVRRRSSCRLSSAWAQKKAA